MNFVPPELLAHILGFVDPHDLVHNCRLVCKNWNQLIIENGSDVWKHKLQHSNSKSLSQFNGVERIRLKLPWYVCYQICLTDPFEKNLLRNSCGHWVPSYYPELDMLQFEHWDLLSDIRDSWIHRYPGGFDPFHQSADFDADFCYRTCFATHLELKKQQTIDLREYGVSRFILDEVQPKIIASEWFSGTENWPHIPGANPEYALKVSLLSSDRQSIIQQKEVLSSAEDWNEDEWKKVSLEFENYGPNVRYVVFYHYAKEDPRNEGLGTKMAGAIIQVALPVLPDLPVELSNIK